MTGIRLYSRRSRPAVSQAVKSVTIARGYQAADRLDCACVPAFMITEVNDVERTAIRFQIDLPGLPQYPGEPEDG